MISNYNYFFKELNATKSLYTLCQIVFQIQLCTRILKYQFKVAYQFLVTIITYVINDSYIHIFIYYLIMLAE